MEMIKENKKVDTILKILIGLAVVFLVYACFLVGFVDTFEHILSSWNISQGKVPYRDFFQHHHPLLWYLFVPVVKVFDYYNSALILFVARFLSLFATLWTAYFLFKIERRFIKIPHAGYLTVLLFLTNNITYTYSIVFRPDSFMLLTAIIGLYYYLAYFEAFKTKNLVYSFLLFFISFMFLQKIVFFLLGVGMLSGVFIFKGKMKIKDLIIASIIPLFLYVLYLFYLYWSGSLVRYFELNVLLNIYANGAEYSPLSVFSTVYFVLAVISSIFIIKTKPSFYLNIINYLFLFCFLLITVAGVPLEYYYQLPVILSSLILSYTVLSFIKAGKKYEFGRFLFLQMVIFMLFSPLAFIFFHKISFFIYNIHPMMEYKTCQFVLDNTDRKDIVFSGDLNRINLFRNHVHPYYIFAAMTIAPKDAAFFDYMDEFDLETLIKENKPKVIIISTPIGGIENGLVKTDETYSIGGNHFYLKLDEETLERYENIPEFNIYLLKQ